MPLALLILGSGIVLVWSALSGQSAWGSVTAVLSGQSLDTKLPDTESPGVAFQNSPPVGDVGGTASTSGLDASGHSVPDLQAYAKTLLAQRGWSNDWDAFNALVMKESGWVWNARNPGARGYLDETHAYGIPQALPPGKMASAGPDWKTNGYTQLRWMMSYIAGRYGSPTAALAWHRSHNWY